MRIGRLVRQLARNDARLILRDPMLVLLLAIVAIMGVAARFALPAIDATLADNGVLPNDEVTFGLAATFPMFVTYIGLWQAALIPGTVFGLLLLDEKEDRTLTAMRVTPVALEHYLAYRVALPTALAFIFGLALVFVLNLAPIPGWRLVPLAFAFALTAPLVSLLFATYADNKVQGLAYSKFAGVAGLMIIVGWFIPEPWQWLFGLCPPFLVAKAYWMALEGHRLWWIAMLVGAGAQAGLLVWVTRRFRAVTGAG